MAVPIRFLNLSAAALAATGASVLLTACTGSIPSARAPVFSSGDAIRVSSEMFSPDRSYGITELAVSDDFVTNGGVAIYNGSLAYKREITNGIDTPSGDWIDDKGNLYVTNSAAGTVTEYKSGKSSPSFVYSTSLVDPSAVITDAAGDVFVADFSPGHIYKYHQSSNTLVAACSTPGGAAGVAIDSNGDVFVSYDVSTIGPGALGEFKGGLAGCKLKNLAPSLASAGGLTIDAMNRLVAADPENNSVYVIPPPYSAIKQTFTGFNAPLAIALNKPNDILFVAEILGGDVAVVKYPSGSPITKITSGIVEPTGVAVAPPAN